jgi:hypothetical protein
MAKYIEKDRLPNITSIEDNISQIFQDQWRKMVTLLRDQLRNINNFSVERNYRSDKKVFGAKRSKLW